MWKKLTGPGLLRLLLAELVYVHHMSRFAVGNAAVYVFFCLSGFWVYSMYTGRYSKTRMPYLTYLVSRLWRLLPTFWLVTLLTFLLIYPDGTLAGYWQRDGAAHFLLSNFLIFGYYFLPDQAIVPAWSLDIEMQFYLIAPLIAILLVRRKLSALLVLLAAAVISVASLGSAGCHLPRLGGAGNRRLHRFSVARNTAGRLSFRAAGRLYAPCQRGACAIGAALRHLHDASEGLQHGRHVRRSLLCGLPAPLVCM